MNDDLLSALELEKAKREADAFAAEVRQSGDAPTLSRMDIDVEFARRKYKPKELEEYIGRLRGTVIDRKAEEILRSKVSYWGDGKTDAAIRDKLLQHNTFEGWRTGIRYIDDALMGIRGGEVTVIAGATNVGKTTFALNIAISVCAIAHKRVLYLSLEMAKEQVENWVANIALPEQYGWLRRGFAVQEERKAGVNELARMLKNERPDFLVVDHLQFLAARSEGFKEYDKITATTEKLHDLALTYRLPVFVISHMNREATRSDKLLTMFDAKGSGSIEGDADSFISLNRDDHNVDNREIVVRLDKCRAKFSKDMYQKFKLLQWDGQRLANNGAYYSYEPERKR